MVFESLVNAADAVLHINLLDLVVLAGFGAGVSFIVAAAKKLLNK